MASDQTQPADLDSILRTLSAITSQNAARAQDSSNQWYSSGGSWPQIDTRSYASTAPAGSERRDAEASLGPSQSAGDPRRQRSQNQRIPVQAPTAKSEVVSASPAPAMDATSIIDWQKGLRHVTKLAARNEQLGSSIQKMIRNQHENEKQWWAGREELKAKQKNRVEDSAKLNAILSSVVPTAERVEAVEVDEAAELRQYDLKVYRCQEQMFNAFSKNLRDLGVPFFETNQALIQSTRPHGSLDEEGETEDKKPLRISERELIGLQRKMIVYLEDMYKD